MPRFGNKPEQHVSVSFTWRKLNGLLFKAYAHYSAWLGAKYMTDWAQVHAPRFTKQKNRGKSKPAAMPAPTQAGGPAAPTRPLAGRGAPVPTAPMAPPPAAPQAPASGFGSVYGMENGIGRADDTEFF